MNEHEQLDTNLVVTTAMVAPSLVCRHSGGQPSVLDLEPRTLYEAIRTRDRRFDGRFFVGVSSTGIYCRPICTVRAPRFENCSFHRTAAAAESLGFRPCLRCRPELAPGSIAPVDAVPRLAALAIRRIEDGALAEFSLDELATEFGVSSRHLRRAVRQEAGVSPVELAQTQRLLTAKQLLTDTAMSVTEVAFAAGFESLRRFNTAFKQRYRLTPSRLRRASRTSEPEGGDAYRFHLGVRPPFDLMALLAFWRDRATPGVEEMTNGWYRRTAVVGDLSGWVEIGPGQKPHTVQVLVSTGLGPVLSPVLARMKSMLDLRADPVVIADALKQDELMATILEESPGIRVPGAFDGFECGVRAIVGQQISVAAATTVAGRIARRFGRPCPTPFESLTTAFPPAVTLAEATIADLQAQGLTSRRAETVRGFAKAVADGQVQLEPGADPDRVRAELLALPGIGEWTAEYMVMRAIGWPDAFPASDLGLVKASGLVPAALRARAENWRPWRSYAAIALWNSRGRSSEFSRLNGVQ